MLISHISVICKFTSCNDDSLSGVCDQAEKCCGAENVVGGPAIRCCPSNTFCGPYHRGLKDILCLATGKMWCHLEFATYSQITFYNTLSYSYPYLRIAKSNAASC